MKNIPKIIILAAVAASAVTHLNAQEVLVGWYTFDSVGSAADDTSPDTVITGVSGNLGTSVFTPGIEGGGLEVINNNSINDSTYGTLFPTDAAPGATSISVNTFGGNDARRIDISVTNTGISDIQVDGIHFDLRATFNPDGASIVVSHLSPASDLDDTFQLNLLDTTTATGFIFNQGFDVTNIGATLGDVTLATGETAAFRIQLNTTSGGGGGNYILDNIALSGTVVPEPGAFALFAGILALGAVTNRRRK